MKKSITKTITSKLFEGSVSRKGVSPMQASFVLSLLLCLLMPQKGWGVTTTMNFEDVGGSKQNYPASTIVTMGDNYSAISGAKVGVSIAYRNTNGNDGRPNNLTMDISRIAFNFNASAGNVNDNNAGFYIRREKTSVAVAGLYTGSSGNKLAVLGLKPGNKVTFSLAKALDGTGGDNAGKIKYIQSVHADEGQGDLYNYNGATLGSNPTLTINSIGDLIIEANQGTYIKSITIEEEIAEYKILTNSDNSTEFWFTAPGSLEENDFAIPYMSVSFGSASDYLVVQGNNQNDYAAHMIQTTGQYAGTETLSTDAYTNFQPSAGNFYAFRPTGGGTVEVSGSLTGNQTHLFVYNPATNSWEGSNGQFYKETYTSGYFSFTVEKDKIYYICINNQDTNEHSYSYHLHWFKFTPTFRLEELAKIVDLDNDVENGSITLTQIHGAGTSNNITVKRCTANIDETSVNARIVDAGNGVGNLVISKPTFASGSDEAGTIILDVKTGGGDAAFVVTFPYHADYNMDEATGRSQGHTWNFLDTRLSDSNIENCKIRQTDGTYATGNNTGILSIGQYKDTSSQFYKETENREWTEGWVIKDSQGNITDPMYKNVFDMVGDNADMIWETEGLWFDTGTNLSCLYNENDNPTYYKSENNQRVETDPAQPTEFRYTSIDPDRYVGLLPDANGASSFTIPGLKDGDRVLIFMKSSAKSGSDREAIFLNIEGAGDAIGTPISSSDLYGAGGAIWAEHERYEGCYHFVKIGDGNMKFTMKRGAICKLMYIHIYSGKRLDTNRVERGSNSPLLFLNDEGTAQENAAGGWYQMHYRGKGELIDAKVIVHSGNLTDDSFSSSGDNKKFVVNDNKTAATFKSTVGQFGVFRLRLMDLDFQHGNIEGQGYKYVCDYADRNFTVGYREKVAYPNTWDFTDMQTFSGTDISTENTSYPETTSIYEHLGWDISLWDADGYMKIATGEDYDDDGDIFSQNKTGFGNQLYANDKIIPETKGLWFYMDNNSSKYNRCAQITAEGLRFANTADGSHTPDWNYKMVVPSVPTNGAVYLRMKRDPSVKDTDVSGGTPFLATKFHFGVASAADKTSLSTSTEVIDGDGNSNSKYSFYQVKKKNTTSGEEEETGEWILAVKNTGDANHLTFTLNGWILEKVAVSTDAKAVNSKGWTSESRTRDIDASLTAYMTGKDIKTYLVGSPDHTKRTLVLTDISGSEANYVLPANTGCVMFNATDENKAEILNGGFHLFVPDMHDGEKVASTTGNLMKVNFVEAQVIPDSEGDLTNYVLAYKYYQLDDNGNKVGEPIEGDEMFYRAANTGIKLHTNSAYLQLPTADVKPKGAAGAKYTFLFAEYDEENAGTSTAIEEIETISTDAVNDESKAQWYNLNGQKLNGKPSARGIYIKDGKKVYIK